MFHIILKNKKMIKWFFLTVFTAFMIFSCAAKKTEKTSVIKISWWGDAYNKKFIERLKSLYEKEHPGVRIAAIDVSPINYEGRILKLAAANDLPDIVLSGVNSYYNFARRGLFKDLTKFAEAKENKEFINHIVDVSLESSYLDGKLYGIPIWDNVFSVFYNKDILRREGIVLPENVSYKEFYKILRKVTIPKEQYGFVGPLTSTFMNWGMWMTIHQFGRDVLSENGKTMNLYNQETSNAFQYMKKLFDEGLIPTTQELENDKGAIGIFKGGRSVFQATGRWGYDSLVAGSGINFGVMRYPHQKKRIMVNSPMWLCITRDANNTEEALQFIEYIGSEKGQKFVYKLRTDISIQKPILMSDTFLKSRGYPEYDRLFRKALLNSKQNRLNSIPGVYEWDRKHVFENLSAYYVNEISLENMLAKIQKGWNEDVAPLIK